MKQTKDVPRGRLFRFGSLLYLGCILVVSSALAGPPPSCHGENFDGRVRIKYVIDGDTVITTEGEHIRLIGIDTPEIDHEGAASEPGAEKARNYLIQLLRHPGTAYPLIYGREKHDRHGRTLAHLFLPGGGNIQALILSRGYATPLTIPPNLRYHDCYRESTEQAYRQRQGLWSLAQYQPIDAADLTGKERGYHLIEGTVTRVGKSRSSIWINLGREFAARIVRKDLDYFPALDADDLIGNRIRVRGKIYRTNSQLRIYLHHGSDIRILPNKVGTR